MRVLETVQAFRNARASAPSPLGFVPTMGYLHQGHMALVRRARQENASVAASIFVNPTQFGPTEDLAKYPRDLPRDLAMLEREGVDLVYVPSVAEMYPQGFQTYVEVQEVSRPLEGEHRPGHFKGVATVVAKLFGIVKPDRAYFGQKDAQQLLVIQQMVRDLDMDIEIVPCPTVREADGLAMSSRNTYLNPQERQAALVLWRSLCLAQEMRQKGERDAEKIRQVMRKLISQEPLARIEYVSVAHPETLQELERVEGPALVSLAVGVGKTRLIDNVTLG